MIGSRTSRQGQRRRAAALAVASSAAAAATAVVAWHLALLVPWAAARGSRGPAWPLLAVTCALATIVLGRLLLSAVATTACGVAAWVADARSSGGRSRELCAWLAVTVSPRVLRPLLASVLAGTVALGTAGAASAASSPSTSSSASASAAGRGTASLSASVDVDDDQVVLPDPGWSSGSAVDPAAVVLPAPTWTPRRPPAPRRQHVDVSTVAAAPSRGGEPAPVVVHRGDTLWSITARHLGAGATDADVAREWPRWWRANRAAVGADPDLLRPGQVLVPPGPEGAR